MEIIITAVGPDNVCLADPIIHDITQRGASIAEIQMYDHDEAAVFAMLCRLHAPQDQLTPIRESMRRIGRDRSLEIRVWSPDANTDLPRIALCGTLIEITPRAVLEAVRSGEIQATVPVLISNRPKLRKLAEEFSIPFEMIGNEDGTANDSRFVAVLDKYAVDYIVLARYMRILPPDTCWKFAGGRIINVHHGLLPSFPGIRPYHDAFAARMLTFGATCHFIVPELDAGNQTINQNTFSVLPGTRLDEIIRLGQTENEPRCLVEGVRRVVQREIRLHFHRVVASCAGQLRSSRQ